MEWMGSLSNIIKLYMWFDLQMVNNNFSTFKNKNKLGKVLISLTFNDEIDGILYISLKDQDETDYKSRIWKELSENFIEIAQGKFTLKFW